MTTSFNNALTTHLKRTTSTASVALLLRN